MIKNGTVYYVHTDHLGSLQVITNANKQIVSSYAYTPWGGRLLLGGVSITDRGYTGHEHLFPFGGTEVGLGLINMNGRVYDPVLARFLSPDPYVQSPDFTQSFNRYSYCWNNPFKYTDPSGDINLGLFYISLNIGISQHGGLSVGVSAGVGVEGWLYVGGAISYGFKNDNWSYTLNAGAFGGYIYGGYDTKAGLIGGIGYAVPSPFSIWSPINITTNMMSAGVDYSQNGGWSANAAGFSYSGNGWDFNPSVGVSATYYLSQGMSISDSNDNLGVVSKDKAEIGSDAQLKKLLRSEGIDPSKYHDEIGGMNEQLPKVSGRVRGSDGIIREGNEVKGGTTISYVKGFNRWSKTFMSPHISADKFTMNLAHEFVHSDIWYKWGYANQSDYNKISESYAYKVNSRFYNIGIEQSMNNLLNYNSYVGNYRYTLPNFHFLK